MSNSRPGRPSGLAWAAAVGWAVLPLFTCGLATPFTIGFAAYWLRSVWQVVGAAVYTVCIGSFVIVAVSYDQFEDIPEPMSTLISLALVVGWLGGVIHSGILVPAMARARLSRLGHAVAGGTFPAGPHAGARTGIQAGPQGPHPHASLLHGRHTNPSYRHPDPHQRPTHPTSQSRPRPGEPEWIGPYRVLRSLGRGGQGAVYLAAAPSGAQVAVKVLHDLVDETARARFAREVDAARRVATFSTARLLDVNITGQHAYIVSEYVDGPSLEQLVRRHGPRDEDGLTRLALSTSGALAAIHKAGIVHRDFKPSNVLIGNDGPRVIDFGIARALDQMTMTSGKMVGTPPYMSPEQLSGAPVGPPSDVFSWAVTMVFAATGRPAFGEDTVPAVFNRVLTVHPDLSPLPPALRGVVGACLHKQPEDRPSASDVMLAIVH
ncbi:putative Ser/Thr protein kinase [Nonomuraea muscovyensis]|uniref:Putative Ser/Thr protein kinase n=1 Tax=Nonomuraea muscovyensis TaxID=1124761 RepID=A0A7X0C3G2_9ACTN|nr:serine/threonine-protein kinase [Nonomuraea muscovyensis]MBB6346755.1 putative Ser/Thr protein kinase [Nonomuraea muscovyensis]